MVGYVKRNAIAGREFESMADLQGHLDWWNREIADVRMHQTTREQPIRRFERDEAGSLASLNCRPTFQQIREVKRRVHSDACIELETNRYSVPWRYIGQDVTVWQNDQSVRIFLAGNELAKHSKYRGEYGRVISKEHLVGVVGAGPLEKRCNKDNPTELLRPLDVYQAIIDGGHHGYR